MGDLLLPSLLEAERQCGAIHGLKAQNIKLNLLKYQNL